jgi:outer membrane protein assembly factor BamB
MQLLDPNTGAIKTSYGGLGTIRTPALPIDGRMAWVERDGVLITADTQNGPHILGPVSDAASDGNHIFFGNIHGDFAAVNEQGVLWRSKVPGPVTGHPVVGDGVVFVCFGARGSQRGGLAALNIHDGSEVWVAYVGSSPSAPAALGEFLIVPSRSGDLIALDARHGGMRWRAPGSSMHTTQPAIVDDAIYVGNGLGRLQRFDMTDGGNVWSIELDAPISGDPVISGNLIVVGTSDGRLVGLSQ